MPHTKVVTTEEIDGKIIRENDTYTVIDNNHLSNLTVSKTILNPSRNTNGHRHEGLDEVYFFQSGNGVIELDEERHDVSGGSIILIKGGVFHKVYNTSSSEQLVFICVFQRYQR